jgi:hypothetical protein
VNLNQYVITALRKEQIYQLTNGQLQPRQANSDSLPDNLSLHFHDNQLYGYRYQWGEETKSFYELDYVEDQIMVKRELTFLQQGDRHFSNWIPHSTQYVCGANSLYRQCTARLQGKWAWLDSTIKLLGKLFDAEGSVVVVDQRPGGTRECAFQQLPANDSLASFSQLYLLEVKRNGDQIVSMTLNAYPLPLPISSPWWARMAACLPIVLLLVFVMKRRRVTRS